MKNLTSIETEQFQRLANRCKFPLPPRVFDGWVENFPTTAIELCIYRAIDRQIEVWMVPRPPNDKHWPNEWHMPGTLIMSGETLNQSYRRLVRSEVGGGHRIPRPKFVEVFSLPKGEGPRRCRRGHGIGLLYMVKLNQVPDNGKWFNTKRLPKKMVSFHRTMIKAVVNELNSES